MRIRPGKHLSEQVFFTQKDVTTQGSTRHTTLETACCTQNWNWQEHLCQKTFWKVWNLCGQAFTIITLTFLDSKDNVIHRREVRQPSNGAAQALGKATAFAALYAFNRIAPEKERKGKSSFLSCVSFSVLSVTSTKWGQGLQLIWYLNGFWGTVTE